MRFGNYDKAARDLKAEDAVLPRAAVLRCRVRYFTDGAILEAAEFARGFVEAWQSERGRIGAIWS